ncbi:FliH/SctL family protein [Alsobacter sp. R-9]
MTARPQKFVFDEEFDRRSGASRRQGDQQRLEEAQREGYERGLLDGRREAEQEAAMRLAQAAEALAGQAAAVIAGLDAERARLEHEAARLALAFARKIAGDLVDAAPLGPLQQAASDVFRNIVGAPHAVVTVPQDQIDRAKALLDRLALERGFAGRLVVLGEPEMLAGDFRIEWADGGVSRDGATLQSLIASAIARHLGATPDGGIDR